MFTSDRMNFTWERLTNCWTRSTSFRTATASIDFIPSPAPDRTRPFPRQCSVGAKAGSAPIRTQSARPLRHTQSSSVISPRASASCTASPLIGPRSSPLTRMYQPSVMEPPELFRVQQLHSLLDRHTDDDKAGLRLELDHGDSSAIL